ncbi:hypothetical protein SMITH_203 [Smithella sp. ME-1]|uniref:Uncharacterized protein n=1 Tax=hydrocarbon metagenome TaxID=938273 RepID=A0A0W8FPU5_9ZZZZ|nr:hypothetical protein SMITH_203 [Smithella sp. ME-1]
MKIDPKQIQIIHIAKKQCGLSDVEYRDIIAGRTNGKKTSSSDLTYAEANAVINYFIKTLSFKIKEKYTAKERAAKKHCMRRWKEGRPANVYCLATHDQLNMVSALAGQIKWRVEDGFHHWMKKYMRINRITTDDEACKVIEGLKGMLANQEKIVNGEQ